MLAWVGAALFAASLVYFLYTYFVTFGEIAAGPVSWTAIALDAALFGAFALHHSVFARLGVRAWVARHLSPASERSAYVWVASLMLAAVCAFWQPVAGVVWDVSGPPAWVLRGVQLFGVWLTLRGAAVLDIWELSGVRHARSTPNAQLPTSKHETAGSEGRELRIGTWEFKTDGPYGWVRHPIYLGWFLLVFAMPRMTMTRLVFAVVSALYILIAIPLEERTLVRASGGAYDAYREKVRWKLFPGLH